MNYAKHLSNTPQSEPIDNTVKNNAGGYVFSIDKWKRLARFLVLGADGGTYYTSEHKLTLQNADTIIQCIDEDGVRVVDMICEFRKSNRAPKISTLLFALALCSKKGNSACRTAASKAITTICWTATQLFEYLAAIRSIDASGRWGSSITRGVANWYLSKKPAALATQMAKYRQRHQWQHRDAIRMSHPRPRTTEQDVLFGYAAGKKSLPDADYCGVLRALNEIDVFKDDPSAANINRTVELIQQWNLPWECIPTTLLNIKDVYSALVMHMPMTAMIRQLGKMSSMDILASGSECEQHCVSQIGDRQQIVDSHVHPITVLSAINTYKKGHGIRGSLTWMANSKILDALDTAFYASFNALPHIHRNVYLGLDVSGSMAWGDIAGVPGLSPKVASAAMAMVAVRTCDSYFVAGFTNEMRHIKLSPNDRLPAILDRVNDLPFGSTDCALPMLDAIKRQMFDIDAFIIYTDNETWAGKTHPVEALSQYRNLAKKPNAKLIVVGMTATQFSIADPQDPNMLDVIGFDSSAPQVIADFIAE